MKRIVSIVLAGALAVACGDSNGPGSAANVQVSFATQRPAAVQPSVAAPDTIVEGANTLILTKAEIVLREIELKRQEVPNCDSDSCEKFEAGPVLVDLPLGPGVQQAFAAQIPPGTYVEIEFDVHKPDDSDPQDQAFIAANPAFANISVRVQGTFNGQPFVFTTDLNVEQELALVPPIVISDAASATNITILLSVPDWFRRADGSLIDPANAGDADLIEENIKNSVEAFEDPDRDGDR